MTMKKAPPKRETDVARSTGLADRDRDLLRGRAAEVKRWRELHNEFDTLLAAYLVAHPKSMPSTISALDLMQWSAQKAGVRAFSLRSRE